MRWSLQFTEEGKIIWIVDQRREEMRGRIWSVLSGVGRIRSSSDRDWITFACLLNIVCSMPITNMPTLNFQLVSLNSANTAAPVPVSRVAGRFLQFSRVTSLANSLLLFLFSFRYRTLKQPWNRKLCCYFFRKYIPVVLFEFFDKTGYVVCVFHNRQLIYFNSL